MWMRRLRTLALVISFGAVSAFSQTAPDQNGSGSAGQIQEDCSAYAAVPLPAEAKRVQPPIASPDCASYRSYRGIGRPVNYTAARACAWKERLAQQAQMRQNQKEPLAWVVGGSLILADIYFNGAGVPRNVPLALRFACEFEEGTARLAFPEVAKLNGKPPAGGRFEFCDYGATTFSMNFCNGYESEIAGDRRARYYESLKARMNSEQRAAFDKLLAAEHAYVETHALEVYQGGTIRTIRTLGSKDILDNLFRAEMAHYERNDWPGLSAHRIATADGLLQQAYEEALRQLSQESKDDIEDGAVTPANLSKAETAWEAYRDAWAAFARARYPAAASAVRAQIVLDRYRLVKTIK